VAAYAEPQRLSLHDALPFGRVAEALARLRGRVGVGEAVDGGARALHPELDLVEAGAGRRVGGAVVDREGRAVGELVRAGGGAGRLDRVDPDVDALVRLDVAGLVGRVVGDRVDAVLAVVGGRRDQDRAADDEAAGVELVVGLVDPGDAAGRARVGRAQGDGDVVVLPAAGGDRKSVV